jgi:predicted permease
LEQGVTADRARQRISAILQQIDLDHPLFDRVRTATITSLREHWLGDSRTQLSVLAASAGLVLLIGVANLAGLMVVMVGRRSREAAVRTALGASQRRLLVLWLTEMAPIAAVSVLGGGLVSSLLIGIFRRVAPADIPRLADVEMTGFGWIVAGGTVLAATLAAAIVARSATGRASGVEVYRRASHSSNRHRQTIREGIVAVQVAVVLALLGAAGLITNTLWNMVDQPLGFKPDGVMVASVTPTERHFAEPERYQRIMNDIRLAVSALPGARRVALSFDPPLAETASRMQVRFTHINPVFVETKFVTDGYVDAMGARVVAGRDFAQSDLLGSPTVLVNERFARDFYGSVAGAVGQRFQFGPVHEVVGVVSDIRGGGLTSPASPVLYPLLAPALRSVGRFFVVSRESQPGVVPLSTLESAIRAVDPSAHVQASWLTDRLREQTAVVRTQVFVLATLALSTLALAVLGIYATVRHAVDSRRRELAIRASLGATPHNLVALSTRGIVVSIATGLLVGGGLGMLVSRVIGGYLFGTSPLDPAVWLVAAFMITVMSLVAAWLPARAAGRVDPVGALRE